MTTGSKIKYFGLSILLVLASINFTRTTLEIVKSSKRLDDTRDEISSLEQQKKDTQESVEYKKSDDFIEKTAREQLNMAKPGESLYVVKGFTETKSNVLSAASVKIIGKKTISDRLANVIAWWRFYTISPK